MFKISVKVSTYNCMTSAYASCRFNELLAARLISDNCRSFDSEAGGSVTCITNINRSAMEKKTIKTNIPPGEDPLAFHKRTLQVFCIEAGSIAEAPEKRVEQK